MTAVALSDIADVLNDAAFSSRDFINKEKAEPDDLPVFKMGNLVIGGGLRQGKDDYIPYDKIGKSQKQITQPHDILMCMTDMKSSMNLLGYSGQITNEKFAVNQRVGIIRPHTGRVNPVYLYYYLNSPNYIQHIRKTAHSGVQVNLSTNAIRNSLIELPSRDEQNRIAESLGSLDEKIKLNQKIIKTLSRMNRALYQHYFIDNPMAATWQDAKFSDVANVATGKGSTKSQLSENGSVPLYGANGIMGTSEDYLYNEPVIITGRVGTLGKVRVVTGKAWFSDNVIIMKPKTNYFGFVHQTAIGIDYISMNRGSTQPLITQTDIKNIPIKIPDEKTLSQFETLHESAFEQQRNKEQEIHTLTVLRNTLHPRLINKKVKL